MTVSFLKIYLALNVYFICSKDNYTQILNATTDCHQVGYVLHDTIKFDGKIKTFDNEQSIDLILF